MSDRYREFLEAKVAVAANHGFDVSIEELHPVLKPHQKAIVRWAVRGGRRAIFAAFGLGKSLMQIETCRVILSRVGGRALIIAPLGVRQEFIRDARMIGQEVRFIRRIEEAAETGIYITNYETVRDGKLDPNEFVVVSLDEAACLRGFGSTLTFRAFMAKLAGDDREAGTKTDGIRYRFVATATPSPNEYIEILAYSAFLGVLDVSAGKTRFFKRNSEKADRLTLHAHKEREFWLWCASWAMFLQRPSDLGFDDAGYDLPALDVQWHEVPTDHAQAGHERDGQGRMFKNAALGVQDASREKRATLDARVAKVSEIVRAHPGEQIVVWCDLNDEQRAIERALDGIGVSYSSLYGSQDIDEREGLLNDWREGRTTVFLSKPMMYGAGVNLQQSHVMIFAGIGFKFYEFAQAIHRIHRFLQARDCEVALVYSEAEREIRRTLETKWALHKELVGQMTAIIREHGLSVSALASAQRVMGYSRREEGGNGWRMVLADTVDETGAMDADSAHLILTSIPFGTQYEYSNSYNDFGHTDDNPHFWRQMDFLTPELFRVLKPGRVAAIHVKDRIVPGGINGFGFQTVNPFSDECLAHFRQHGFAFLARKTIVTDVVRENNQTYRLGWTEQCKDGTRMGCGMPEYLLLFRKPPSDTSNGYADQPVVKPKPDCYVSGSDGPTQPFDRNKRTVPGTGYSRGRWQLDAHGFAITDADRLLLPEELQAIIRAVRANPDNKKPIYRGWKKWSEEHPYSFDLHVAFAEELDRYKLLPPDFMLIPPHSKHPDVWTDIARMRTLNGAQQAAGREQHLCPLQLQLVDRVIVQHTMPGELVYDPFAGIGTVPVRALALRRRGLGCELSERHFNDAAWYCREQERKKSIPTLFEVLGIGDADAPEEEEAAA